MSRREPVDLEFAEAAWQAAVLAVLGLLAIIAIISVALESPP